MTNTMMMPDLPGDLIEEILCRVPATSLKQLRSTCKRWNSLFSNGRFTRKHLDKAAKQFLILMLNEYRVCSMSVNLHGIPSVEVTGKLSLIAPHSSLDQVQISEISHCDGLLLCTFDVNNRILVWNPCNGQTKWILSRKRSLNYALGSYQDNKSHGNSYKILSYFRGRVHDQELAIYAINSDSWRILHVTLDFHLEHTENDMSLKGTSYWFASDEKEKQLGIFLVGFNFTTETFGRLRLPYQFPCYKTMSLSVVREEKLSVLLQRENTSKTEIWVTNKIGETKVVSWSMLLAVDFPPELFIWNGISFLVHEEKKFIVCCDKYMANDDEEVGKNLVHIIGEDNKVIQVDFGLVECGPFLFNYVPSLTQIKQGVGGGKRKRDE